jgi:hypothetical protein
VRNRPRPAADKPPGFWERFGGFWKQRWTNIEPVAAALIEDCMLFLLIIAILSITYYALGILAGLGYKQERVERIETIHYWAYLTVFTTMMADFVVRVTLHLFFGRRKNE